MASLRCFNDIEQLMDKMPEDFNLNGQPIKEGETVMGELPDEIIRLGFVRKELNDAVRTKVEEHDKTCGGKSTCLAHLKDVIPMAVRAKMVEDLFWVCMKEDVFADMLPSETIGYRVNADGKTVTVKFTEKQDTFITSISMMRIPPELAALIGRGPFGG